MIQNAIQISPPGRAGQPPAPDTGDAPSPTAPFARALDQANAQQRGSADEAAAGTRSEGSAASQEAVTSPAHKPAQRPSTDKAAAANGNPHPAGVRKAAAQTPSRLAGDAAETPGLSVPVQLPAGLAATDDAAGLDAIARDTELPEADVPGGFDLAAWLPGLPLPPALPPQTQVPVDAQEAGTQAALAGAEPDPADAGLQLDTLPSQFSDPGDAPDRAGLPAEAAARQATRLQAEAPSVPWAPQPADDPLVRPSGEGVVPGLSALRSPALRERGAEGGAVLAAPAASINAVASPSASSAVTAGLPFQAELHAALGTPAFVPALGAQLSVLVRDGIEHARLKLNPAEMGPIDVRISLNGQQAQVDFSAAHAETRQILQDAVPALASALRESGLTLTGGGVFDQAREQRGDTGRGASPQRSAFFDDGRDLAPASQALARATPARGVVDLYA